MFIVDTLITITAFLLILSLLVFVHEWGHFVVAKRAGITVEEFAIGFPPRAVKIWQDEGSITLDGAEYIIGRKTDVPRTVVPGVLVYAETDVDAEGRPVVTRLEAIDTEEPAPKQPTQGSEARIMDALRLKNESRAATADERPTQMVDALIRPTEYTLNWVPFGGYVRMVGEEDPDAPGSFASKSKRVRFAVLVAGSLMNLLTAVVFFTLMSLAGVPEPITSPNLEGEETSRAQTVVTAVVPGSPADQAGIQPADVFVGSGDIAFSHIGDLVYFVSENKGHEIDLQLERGGEPYHISLVPRVNPPPNEGAIGVAISYEGIESEIVYYSVPEAMWRGVSQTARYIGLTFYVPIAVLSETLPAEVARPTGPVGIYQQTDSAVDAAISLNWWFPVLGWIAVLSTALAITNLLPLPALDGGRILFIVIEAIRGKRVSPEKEGAIHFIGLAFLLMLMVVISYYDFSNPLPTVEWDSLFLLE